MHDTALKQRRSRLILRSLFWLGCGIVLGILAKYLDETAINLLPSFLQALDLGNFLSRMGIWLFFGAMISLLAETALQAAGNVFLFFAGMVFSYYWYTYAFAGFLPVSYMKIWIILTLLSPMGGWLCVQGKRNDNIGTIISVLILTMLWRQALAFGFWYLDIRSYLELLLCCIMILFLYRGKKQTAIIVAASLLLYFLTAQISLLGGMM